VRTRFLGVDLGTTFMKGAVLDLDRKAIAHIVRLATPGSIPGLPATRHELDPAAILATVCELLRELIHEAPDAAGLVMCSQMHGVVFEDDRGNPRSNVITWKDQRAREPIADRQGTHLDGLVRTVTPSEQHDIGGELRVGVPITTLSTMRQTGELPNCLYPASLPDFVLADLCDAEPTTEATNAAAHGLFHLDRHDWHRDLIAKLGLDGLRWPRVRKFGEVIGIAEIDGHRLTCFTPVGDQQCALVGVGLCERELSLNISTGSQVSLVSRERPRGDFQVRPYFDGKWLRTLVSVPAGRSLGLLVDLLTEIGGGDGDPWDYISRAVDSVTETDLEVDLSFFASMTGDRGQIANIREGNLTVGHLFAAAFRSMAANYARCAGILSPNRDWDRVVFSGGLAQRFPRLRQEILAALGNPPSRLSDSEEDTLEGLLELAGRLPNTHPSPLPHSPLPP
jgi:sugar (pentulose or hexulose) kinase